VSVAFVINNTPSHIIFTCILILFLGFFLCLCVCRCREDERPLNQLLVLQLEAEHPNGRYNISMCKIFGNHWNQEKRRFLRGAANNSVMNLITLKMQTLNLLLNMTVQVGRIINICCEADNVSGEQ